MGTQSCHRSEGRVKRIVQGHVQIDSVKNKVIITVLFHSPCVFQVVNRVVTSYAPCVWASSVATHCARPYPFWSASPARRRPSSYSPTERRQMCPSSFSPSPSSVSLSCLSWTPGRCLSMFLGCPRSGGLRLRSVGSPPPRWGRSPPPWWGCSPPHLYRWEGPPPPARRSPCRGWDSPSSHDPFPRRRNRSWAGHGI